MSAPVIVVDDAIAQARAILGELGEVHPLAAASIDGPTLAALGARALVVRSVTRVDAALLDACALEFVGTATAGLDHLDLGALAERGIHVADAAGCNARAVAEWVAAALLTTRARWPAGLDGGPVGVVGLGHVGSQVAGLARALGLEVLACDPFLAARPGAGGGGEGEGGGGGEGPFVSFEELWARCSIVSFHVPLTRDGPHPTFGLLDRERPQLAGPKLVVNTSRGAVVRDRALDRPDVAAAILDVWEGEPSLALGRLRDPKLLLASPHVAGYSLDAKIEATLAVARALGRRWGRDLSTLEAARWLPAPKDLGAKTAVEILETAVDLRGDDRRVRGLAQVADVQARSQQFEDLRRSYVFRREFGAWRAPRVQSEGDRAMLQALGFGAAEQCF